MPLQKNDSIYLFTDGFIDQFGGEKNKKLNKTNFKDLLNTIHEMNMDEHVFQRLQRFSKYA